MRKSVNEGESHKSVNKGEGHKFVNKGKGHTWGSGQGVPVKTGQQLTTRASQTSSKFTMAEISHSYFNCQTFSFN